MGFPGFMVDQFFESPTYCGFCKCDPCQCDGHGNYGDEEFVSAYVGWDGPRVNGIYTDENGNPIEPEAIREAHSPEIEEARASRSPRAASTHRRRLSCAGGSQP